MNLICFLHLIKRLLIGIADLFRLLQMALYLICGLYAYRPEDQIFTELDCNELVETQREAELNLGCCNLAYALGVSHPCHLVEFES